MADAAYAEPMSGDEGEPDFLLQSLVKRLQDEAERRVSRRDHIEERWLDDLRQYHGRYDPETEKRMEGSDRSKLFINQTRTKTNAMAARLEDMLFPTDDRNWGIEPTPRPELTREAEAAAERAQEARKQVPQPQEGAEGMQPDPQAMALQQQADEADSVAQRFRAIRQEAERRARAMELEIEDQLVQSCYQAQCRDVIADACRIGTGVLKGPVMTAGGMGGRWEPIQGQDGATVYQMAGNREPVPGVRWCDPWAIFFDPDARTLDESEGVFERHILNRKSLRRLAREPGFDKDAIRRVLAKGAPDQPPDYLHQLRNIGGDQDQIEGPVFTVWEYSGPLDSEELEILVPDEEKRAAAYGVESEIDPLMEVNVVLWFCDGEVLRVGPHPLDSGECLYSVFTLEPEEGSIYGYGIPRIMRDQQAALNAAWRISMDNAGFAAGPQIIFNQSYVEPADGKWELRPLKVWKISEEVPKTADVFMQFQPHSNLEELTGLIDVIMKQIDDVTGLPMIAQGEQGTDVTKTAQGMSLLMSSSNVMFRRIVKRFDDDLTVPTIRRMHDWNMQNHPNPDIKGDYEVDARGAGVLLVREMQAQNLMTLAAQFGAHPAFGGFIRHADLLRSIVRAHTLKPDDIVKTDEDVQQEAAAAAEQEDPAVALENRKLDQQAEEMELKAQIANQENATRLQIAKMNHEAALIQATNRANVAMETAEAKMADNAAAREAKERDRAIEVGMKERTGDSAGGAI